MLRYRQLSTLALCLQVAGFYSSFNEYLAFITSVRQIYFVFNVRSLSSSFDLSFEPLSYPLFFNELEVLKKKTVLFWKLLGDCFIQLFYQTVFNIMIMDENNQQFLKIRRHFNTKIVDIIRSLNKMINEKSLCLNPKCPRSKQCILDSDQLKNHKNCSAWIISQSNIYLPYTSYKHPIQNQIHLDFQQDGINFIKKIASLELWPYQLERIFQELKSHITNQIDMLKNQKILQFNQIYMEAKQAFIEITETMNKIGKDSLFIQLKKLYQLQKYSSINLCQVDKMKHFMEKSVKECIRSLGNLVQSPGYTFNQIQQKSKKKAYERVNNFFFQENINSTNQKIMKLANTFQVPMAKATFDNQLALYKTNCWICDKVITSVKQESTRNGCLHQLFIHLTTEHYKQTYQNYMRKILKYDVEEISFQSFMGKIKTEKLKEVYVIDRENAGSIERPMQIQEGQFFIEVMNKQNKNLAKGAYMLADSTRKDAADILITIIIYQMLNYDVGKIFLVTKDHFGVTFLEVVGNMFPGKLQCIHPKQFCQRLYGNGSMESETK